MSGPVGSADTLDVPLPAAAATAPQVELVVGRAATVGAMPVHRVLPRRARRTVGAWCFADQMGPAVVSERHGVDIGPHPHIGLHTVTWLLRGEILHRDSLGSEQVVRPGQLNLMTAGHGVAHSEEATGHYRGDLLGVQLWVAQPDATRHGPAAFEHHADLPQVELPGADVIVIVGALAGATAPTRADSPLVGADLDLRTSTVLPLRPDFEHALVVVSGAVLIGEVLARPGELAFLGCGRDELAISAAEPARVLLIGGAPLDEPLLVWWNYVARTRTEVEAAATTWNEELGGTTGSPPRFGRVRSPLPAIPAPAPPWSAAPRG